MTSNQPSSLKAMVDRIVDLEIRNNDIEMHEPLTTEEDSELKQLYQKISNYQNIEEKIQNRINEIVNLLEQKNQTYNTMFDALEAKGKSDPNTHHYYKSEYNALNKILEESEELRKERGYLKSLLESN